MSCICHKCKGQGYIIKERGKLADNNTIGEYKQRYVICKACRGSGIDEKNES